MYQKFENLFYILKTILIIAAIGYIIFWFWRFFNLPFAQNLVSFFDFLLIPIKSVIETLRTTNAYIIEFGYIFMGVLFGFLACCFDRLEAMTYALEAKRKAAQFIKNRDEEEKVNAELAKEYIEEILKYKLFSIYVRYKISYENEIVAQNNSYTIAEIAERSYSDTSAVIRRNLPNLGVRRNKASVFIRAEGFRDFDKIVSCVLAAIKKVKEKNFKDAMNTNFLIVLDAQKTEFECSKSIQKLMKIAECCYFNKAIVTTALKHRLDMFESPGLFETELLGVFTLDKSLEPEEVYLLKSKK